jgi:hypothetical protein
VGARGDDQLDSKTEYYTNDYREGKSQREIQRESGVDRKTNGKYIAKYEQQWKELLQGDQESVELLRSIVETPKYTMGVRPARKLTVNMKLTIQGHLDENEEKRRKGQRKQ